MRKTFTMNDEQLKSLIDAARPSVYLVANGSEPLSPQESANNAWKSLAKDMGFKCNTVRPEGSDPKNFTAEAA